MTDPVLDKARGAATEPTKEQGDRGLTPDAAELVKQFTTETARDAAEALGILEEGMQGVMHNQRQALFTALRRQRQSYRRALEEVEDQVKSPDIREVIEKLRSADLPPATLTAVLGEFLGALEGSGATALEEAKQHALDKIEASEQELHARSQGVVDGLLKQFASELVEGGGLDEGRIQAEVRNAKAGLQENVTLLFTSTVSDDQILNHVEGLRGELSERATRIHRKDAEPTAQTDRVVRRILRAVDEAA